MLMGGGGSAGKAITKTALISPVFSRFLHGLGGGGGDFALCTLCVFVHSVMGWRWETEMGV